MPQPRLSWGTESLDACGERVDGHSGPQASRPVPPLPPPGVCPPEDAGATGRQTPDVIPHAIRHHSTGVDPDNIVDAALILADKMDVVGDRKSVV